LLKFLRFSDLQSRGICGSWARLKELVEKHDFPPGKLTTPNCRTWTEQEIDEWYASRPSGAKSPLKGRAKRLVETKGTPEAKELVREMTHKAAATAAE
jgi:hypothetical protein